MTTAHRLAPLLVFLTVLFSKDLFAQAPKSLPPDYGKASYDQAAATKFMKFWLVTGPIPVRSDTLEPTDAAQESRFKENEVVAMNNTSGSSTSFLQVNGKKQSWQLLSSATDVVDLDAHFGGKDFVAAYAMAELKATKPGTVFLGLGSDDGVRVWLNGKLVHSNWIPRSVKTDDDLVPLNLVKGSNQLLLKVQDIQGGWAFVARLLDKKSLTKKLSDATARGDLEQIPLLLKAGAVIDGMGEGTLSPIAAAKLNGRDDVVELLLKSGATNQPLPSLDSLIGQFYYSLNAKEGPGVAVLLAKDGDILYEKGFGYADIKNKVLVSPATKFRIGSVTKQFTAAAILKLQEDSLLRVTDKLSRYIPDFPRGDEVTLHQLLTHTSGIHSYTNNPDFVDKVTKTISPDSLVAMIKKDPFDFNPGERFLYNNSGYFLLGYIIEKLTGKPYGAYLKETFFDPLQMTSTGVHHAGIRLENEARGYAKSGDHYVEALNWDMSWAGGAGALYSTVEDLLKWNQALYSGKVLRKESLQAALTPVVLKNGEKPSAKYGYGLGLSRYRGIDIISHSGGLHGFVTQLAYYPNEKVTVVMFSNTAEPEVNFDPNAVAETWLWEKMEKQPSYTMAAVRPKNLQPFVGRYDLTGAGVLTITTDEGKLYAQLSGQPRFEIFPSSEKEFFWKVANAKIKFVANEKGIITQGVFSQNGAEIIAKKLPEETIVTIDPSVLDSYTGKYKLNNLVVTLTKENNRLYAQPTGQQKLELQPVSETAFVIKEINARVQFIKEADGNVKKFMLTMNGTTTELPRIE